MQGLRVAVVGGSSGIGLAVAAAALHQGAEVVIGGRDRARLTAAEQAHPGLRAIPVDAIDGASLDRFFAELGEVDHIYHAAGGFIGGTAAEGDLDAYRAALEPRIWGVAHLVRASHGRIRSGGSIILTGGLSTDRPIAGAWITSVGTAAAEQSARALALELAPVRVNAVAPGWTDTPLWDGVFGADKAATLADVAARLPAGHVASAGDVAAAVLFLMQNRSVTGEIVHVDGGHRLI